MKINLKKKIMFALLAGGMLCTNSVFAANTVTVNGVTKTLDLANYGLMTLITGAPLNNSTITFSLDSDFITKVGDNPDLDVVFLVGSMGSTGDNSGNTIRLNAGNFFVEGCSVSSEGIIGMGGLSQSNFKANSNNYIVNGGKFVEKTQDGRFKFYGAKANEGEASHNILSFTNSTFVSMGDIWGAFSDSGDASDNQVTFTSCSKDTLQFQSPKDPSIMEEKYYNVNVYGGQGKNANGNIVTVKNAEISSIKAGYATDGDAKDNKIEIFSGNVGDVIAGYVRVDNNVAAIADAYISGNSIVIHGGNINGNNINASNFVDSNGINAHICNNNVLIENMTATQYINIRGGYIEYGGANNIIGGASDKGNSVVIKNATFNDGVYIYGGQSGNWVGVSYNSVTIGTENGSSIISGTLREVCGGYNNEGGGDPEAFAVSHNNVTIYSGNYEHLYGGRSGNSNVDSNEVSFYSGKVYAVVGGRTGVSYEGTIGKSKNNKVNIADGTVSVVVGGWANGRYNWEGPTKTYGSVEGNIVNISGGTFVFSADGIFDPDPFNADPKPTQAFIIGGFVKNAADNETCTIVGGEVKNNIVNISAGAKGVPDLSKAGIYGYYGDCTSGGGNTLNLSTAISAVEVANFENVNITLPSGLGSDDVVLSTNKVFSLDGITLSFDNLPTLATDQYITLMNNVDGTWSGMDSTHYEILDLGAKKELVYFTSKTAPIQAKADYTITHGSATLDSTGNAGNTDYNNEIIGNNDLSSAGLSNWTMLIRRGQNYNGAIKLVVSGDNGATINNNSMTINAGTFNDPIYVAYYNGSTAGNITDNNITILDGTFEAVCAAYGQYGNLSGNTINITAGTFKTSPTYDVYAAWVEVAGSAVGNKITIDGGTFEKNKNISAGYVGGTGNATNNEITINDGTFGGTDGWMDISAGYSDGGDITGNKVYINGGSYGSFGSTGGIYGGYLRNSNPSDAYVVSGNEVNITAGNFNNSVSFYGGFAHADADNAKINGNKVNMSNIIFHSISTEMPYPELAVAVYGGCNATKGEANGNIVKLNNVVFREMGGNTTGDIKVYGGTVAKIGTASNNEVLLDIAENGFENRGIIECIGGAVYNTGASADSCTASSNVVTIKNKAIFNKTSGKVAGGYVNGTGTVEKNIVNIDGGNFCWETQRIYGGYALAGTVQENKVNITDGSLNNAEIYGGYIGDSNSSTNNKNEVYISGGYIDNCKIYGGYTVSASTPSTSSTNNVVKVTNGNIGFNSKIYGGYGVGSGNKVEILGGTFNCDEVSPIEIWGGYANTGTTSENEITVTGGTNFANVKLFGGQGDATTSIDNTLNVKIKMNGKLGEIKYFQIMNFTLPVGIEAGDTIMNVANVVFDSTNKTTINVYSVNDVKLNKDDTINLIVADNAFVPTDFTAGEILGGKAELQSVDGDKTLQLLLLEDFEQKAPPSSDGSEDEQKAPVEGVAAAAVTVNASADLAGGEGMASLLANTAGGTTDTFGAASAGSSKYKTGSHVDADGWGILVGAGKTREWKNGEATTYGLFFEYGKSDFDTYNSGVHGEGNSNNKGVGIMLRHKLVNNTYYEGNIRYGKVETEWSQSELGGYDIDSRYYGLMVGMGHIFKAGKNEIDVYGRYLFGHTAANDATIGTAKYHFGSVKSHRVRIGGKYNFVNKGSNAKPYIGLAWEHEFKGESKATISGVGEAPSPSMKGHTGIMEVGCDWDVSKKWTVGLGANAYIGKRKGWDGMARVFYNF